MCLQTNKLPLTNEVDGITMSHKLTKEELDEQFELFLKESVSDDSVDLGSSEKKSCADSSNKSPLKPAASWLQDDEHCGGGTERGLLGSGKSFRKSLRKSHHIREEDENPVKTALKEEGLKAVVSRDNTETEESLMALAMNMSSIGLDTLEEEEEKARFFAQLEEGTSSKIDYSKLNRELDSTSSTIGAHLRKSGEAEEENDCQSKDSIKETIRTSSGSPHYSEDFEEEESGKEPQEEKSRIVPVTAKGPSYVQSGGSDIEALHKAYREIHVVGDSEDYNRHYSLEGEESIHKPLSPSASPQHGRQSLHPASTNESDVPTAEELMRPIRFGEEHIRGFILQPVSALEPRGKTSNTENTFSDVAYTESLMNGEGKGHHTVGLKRAKGLTSSSPETSNHDLMQSIREEVEGLMKDHKSSPDNSSQAGKIKKLPSQVSTISQLCTTPLRKPTNRGRKTEGKIAVSSRPSRISRTTATAKTCSPEYPQKSTMKQGKEEDAAPGLKVGSELVASVQSLVAVLQQQVNTSRHQETTLILHPAKSNKEEEEYGSVVKELRVQLAQKEKELQMIKQGAEELASLRQQNYLLQIKLRSAEEASQRKMFVQPSDPATEEKLKQIEKDMKEQETLIKGYQQENEKLYRQIKAEQTKSKANEEAMFNENRTLLNELEYTRDQLSKTSMPAGNICLMDHTQRITDLLAQINTLQRNKDKMSEEVCRLKQEKQALEVNLQLTKKERDLAKAQAISASGDKDFEVSVLKDKHKEEVFALNKKLHWFSENQELLDRDAGRLKAATAEIHQLKEQVETLKLEVGKCSSGQQKKAKEKSADVKRMQYLEQQVKELEQILRHRNPNSLPALIYAAASAGGEDVATKTGPPSRVNVLLENRILRLEAELEDHDKEAKRSLRAMEQRFHSVKLRYEQQISELEQQLEQKVQVDTRSSEDGTKVQMSQVQSLEEELQPVKETHQEEEKSFPNQIEFLQHQLKNKDQPNPGRHQRQTETAFYDQIERLNRELTAKTQTIQELSRTVDKLHKERRNMLAVPSSQPEIHCRETRRQPALTKTPCSAERDTQGKVPAAQYEKTYQPNVFEVNHISEIQEENEVLRQRLELLQLHCEQEKEVLKAEAVQAKEELSRLKVHSAQQLSSMQAEHLRELDQLRAAQALEHSSSKVAEQANRINSQEVMVKHLQEQVKELKGAKEKLQTSRTQENALQKQLSRLLKELKEAKEAQSPEAKLLCSLKRRIIRMELRHQHREKELKQVIGGSWQMLEANQQPEVERWKHLAQEKSRELEAFRVELDSILDILRHLQRQAVVPPPPPPH
ncbi:centrosomal protein of 162 kDa isoform X2 [Echeneis naucrates]|nr:centrosomal protein of 162 kDa isoform X2 [Echeneis naucrates]